MFGFPLFPEQASTMAGKVDALYYYLVGVSLFFSLLIFLLLLYFAIKYRRRSEEERPDPIWGNLRLEILWIGIPFILGMIMFGWGANLYFQLLRPPADALEIFVVGKQWMWKIQHPQGRREINQLHVPVGYPVKLTMTSEDVIHDFYIPAFRTKMDVVPGRFTRLWFQATKIGEYQGFCAEYCGTKHSRMLARIVVMRPQEYEQWLEGEGPLSEPMSVAGEKLVRKWGCVACHKQAPDARGPSLFGLFGRPVPLATGETVIADENYIRESILTPRKKIVAGYDPIMPTFQGQISEEDLINIIAYIKTLGPQRKTTETQ